MTYQVIKLIHLLSLFVWIGGMMFSHFSLRKPLAMLALDQRVPFVRQVMLRFLNAVSISVVLVLLSGLWMIGRTARQFARTGLTFEMPWSWTFMATFGIIMIAIFGHIRVVLYRRLSQSVKSADWTSGAAAINSIRQWMAVNLGLGVLIIVVAVLG